MRHYNEQIYLKKGRNYVPYTPTNGWDDDKVFNNGEGIYLINVNPNLTMEQCVLKLYDLDELKNKYNNKIIVTKEELKPIIQSYVIDGYSEKTIFGNGKYYNSVVLEEQVDDIVDVCYNILNGLETIEPYSY